MSRILTVSDEIYAYLVIEACMRGVSVGHQLGESDYTGSVQGQAQKSAEKGRANNNQAQVEPESRKVMKECLKVAAQIRQELAGRSHSNSTKLAAEDRQR